MLRSTHNDEELLYLILLHSLKYESKKVFYLHNDQ
jgi:hypothetical protein